MTHEDDTAEKIAAWIERLPTLNFLVKSIHNGDWRKT